MAVIDTGVDLDHPFLEGRILDNGWDFAQDDDDPDDDHYHGTHCAGIVRDATSENVKILPVKVLDSFGAGANSVIAEGITYAADCGADILSMSFGGSSWKSLSDAIDYATEKGVIAVAAAGNDAHSLDKYPTYPACCDGVITVAATDQTDYPAYYSNYGSCIDIAAPGSNIISSVPDGKFETYSGTSMACPLVAGCAALLKSEDSSRTKDEILTVLSQNARDTVTPGRDEKTGAGIVYLGAYRAVEAIHFQFSELTLDPWDSHVSAVQFEPKYPSNCVLRFTADDPDVVEIRGNGTIIALKSGTTKVHADHAESGLSAEITVTVAGDGKRRFAQIVPDDYGTYFVQNNGTGYLDGERPASGVGRYLRSRDWQPVRLFASSDADLITDIARIEGRKVIRSDGTLWLQNIQNFRTFVTPVQALFADGTPVTGVKQALDTYLLTEDGSVWLQEYRNAPYYTPLMTEDGVPLTNVKKMHKIGSTYNAVTYSGNAYAFVSSSSKDNYYPCAFYLRDINGNLLQGVEDAYSCVGAGRKTALLTMTINEKEYTCRKEENYVAIFKDGSVRRRSGIPDDGRTVSHTALVSTCINFGESFGGDGTHQEFYTLRADGSVYCVSTGTVMKKTDGETLTGVQQLFAHEFGGVSALCADGTVWAWGENGLFRDSMDDGYGDYGLLGVGWQDGLYRSQEEEGLKMPVENLSEDGLTFVAPDKKYLYDRRFLDCAVQVKTDASTPLTNVVDICSSERQVIYICADGRVHQSGMIQYSYNYFKMAVYAIPMEIYGQQVWLEETQEENLLGTERLKKIQLSRLNMAAAVGEKFSLKASLEPSDTYERNIYWRSSDPTVAKVDNVGNVTALSPGTAVIRAYCSTNAKVWGHCIVQVETKAPKKVTLVRAPSRREYTTADTELQMTDGLLRLEYSNAVVINLFLSPDYCSGYDLSEVGEQTVTITFAGQSFSYPITVKEAEPDDLPQPDRKATGIRLLSMPNRTEYFAGTPGELIDPDGAQISVLYSDGTEETVPVGRENCYADLSAAGEQTVTVYYQGFSCTFQIHVMEPQLVGLEWTFCPNYNIGIYKEEFCCPFGCFMEVYENGRRVEVALSEEMCSGYDMNSFATQEVTVSHKGFTLTYEAQTRLPSETLVDSIELYTVPKKRVYYRGAGTIDPTGGTSHIVKMSSAMVDNQAVTLRQQEIIVTYLGKKTSFTVRTVSSLSSSSYAVQSIYITKLPNKMTYFCRDYVVLTGGKVYILYADGFEGEVEMDRLSHTPSYASKYPGACQITLQVEGVELSFPIEVVEKTEESENPPQEDTQEYSFYLWTLPSKTVYCVGEPLDVSGGIYGNGIVGTNSIQMAAENCSGYDMNCVGKQTITVTDERISNTLTFDVFVTELVLENEVPEIEVGKCTRVLATFQPVDVDGREILWTSSDPDIATVDAYGRVTGIAPGSVEITARVAGSTATASCTVSVKERQSVYMPGDADGDGEVDLVDVAMIRRYLAGGWNAVIDLQNADVNRDGSVDLRDCVTLERYLAGGWNISL